MDGTAALMMKVLDCLSARSVATAQNIANAGTPGYRPVKVSFEQALSEAAAQGDVAIDAVTPQVQQLPLAPGGMRLDLETAVSASTAQRYGAVVDVLGRQMQLQTLAITGND